MTSGGVRVMSFPSKCTVPERGRSSPEMARRQVVFPAPLPPSSASTSLGRTSKLTPNSAWKSP